MKPIQRILIIDIVALVGSFFLIWNLSAGYGFLIPTMQTDYIKSLPLALMYTTLVGILTVLGTALLFLPRRKNP